MSRRYIGSSTIEEEAARLYDERAIQMNGLKAKTNFAYSKREVEEIIKKSKS